MEAVSEIIQYINSFFVAMKINGWYVLLWVAAGYIQKIYLATVTRFGEAWKTLILGSLFSVGYAFLLRNVGDKSTWVEFFASYIFATSLYELLIKDLGNKILAFVRRYFNSKLAE